jgi:phospholipase C
MNVKRWIGAALAAAVIGVCGEASTASALEGTATPIGHVVVIFQENNAFDHYFGTYPFAENPPGETPFFAAPGTPTVNGLIGPLLNNNPNVLTVNAQDQTVPPAPLNPFRLDPKVNNVTCDNDNAYDVEQEAYDHGLGDQFQLTSATPGPATPAAPPVQATPACQPGLSMGYYDGNTVTALWNYAQNFAMSDAFFDAEFGTTVMGHINLISGQTHQAGLPAGSADVAKKVTHGTIIANINPDHTLDDCSTAASSATVKMTGHNVGDLLNKAGVTWGWFYADFGPATPAAPGVLATCTDLYDAHYDPFNYYPQTANPHHLPPTSLPMVGRQGDQANHQYTLQTFFNAAAAGHMPAVSFLKAPFMQNGHPQKSDPLDEQTFLVDTINALQRMPEWRDMAIIIAYDDSDGWYDHVMPPIVNQSNDPALDHICGQTPMAQPFPATAFNDRCGYGSRLPMLVISPYAKTNYVDHTTTDTTSILRFIEDNWHLGRIDDLDHPGGTPAGQGSFDQLAGPIDMMFDFERPNFFPLFLNDKNGTVVFPRPNGLF